ncbi:hypothetical protein [Actinoplanes regularis]|uniref:hypothetical protein n=1 Tax=Actinoplanes regularis TaxID=52697 RepID=UPI0025553FCA|nr:hypothetical protein [Actinoplanes regularis]GLW27925.1 hypothetical protein Areg01_08650 [Actinoplanes regularis]
MFRKNIVKYVDDLVAANAARDGDRFHEAVRNVARSAGKATPEQAHTALTRLAPVLESIPFGIGNPVAGLAGGIVGLEGDFRPVLPVLVDRAIAVLTAAVRFHAFYQEKFGEEPPDAEDEAAVLPTLERVAHPETGSDEGRALGEAWFTANEWVQPVLFLCQRKDVRAALPRRAELTAAVAATTELVGAAGWLNGLLQVLDDETLLVLDRASGRAFRVTISGIGDNFQLHTLLAAALPAEVLPGSPPSAAEVAAASTGDLEPPGGIRGNFNLADANGKWIWNEGRPVDIPHLDGVRVAVVDPPPYTRTWNAGRAYPLMIPSVQLTAEFSPADAATLRSKIKTVG